MKNNVQDILFEYLKNVIYSPEKAHLDLDQLPKEFHDLGEGMIFLGQCVKEQKIFGKSLIQGDFDKNVPNVENGIAAPLKEVHGVLKHLVWQSKEVAKGDYSQTLDYFGELSEAFNSMIAQLKEREDNLKSKNKELLNLKEMFKNITIDAPYFIFVVERDNGQVTYLNKKAERLKQGFPGLYNKIFEKLLNCYEDKIITIENDDSIYRTYHYQIMTKSNEKDDNLVYMVIDVTNEMSKTKELEEIAYRDPLTGLCNRRYGQEVMNKLLNDGFGFAVAFIDIDHLKYCNDIYGHEKGDGYILQVSEFLKNLSGDKTICRVGGDEFLIIKPGCAKEDMYGEMYNLWMDFKESNQEPFLKSFSFGVSEYIIHGDADLTTVLSEADMNMYQFKIKYKQKIKHEDQRMK